MRIHRIQIRNKTFNISVSQDSEGKFIGKIHEFQNYSCQGETFDELMKNVKQKIELFLDNPLQELFGFGKRTGKIITREEFLKSREELEGKNS